MKGVQTLWMRCSAAVKCHSSLHFMICCLISFPFQPSLEFPRQKSIHKTFFFLLYYFSVPSHSQCRHTSMLLQHPPYSEQLSYSSVTSAKGPLKDISTMPKILGPFPCRQVTAGRWVRTVRGHWAPGPDFKQKHSLCKNHLLFPWRSEKQNSGMLTTLVIRGC